MERYKYEQTFRVKRKHFIATIYFIDLEKPVVANVPIMWLMEVGMFVVHRSTVRGEKPGWVMS